MGDRAKGLLDKAITSGDETVMKANDVQAVRDILLETADKAGNLGRQVMAKLSDGQTQVTVHSEEVRIPSDNFQKTHDSIRDMIKVLKGLSSTLDKAPEDAPPDVKVS